MSPPRSEAELLARAEDLSGRTLGEVARRARLAVPASATKGWAGQLLEVALGATAGAKAEPDFPGLGIELKTVPIDRAGRPRQTTYVCVAPLDVAILGAWDESWPRRKLARVLWMPLVAADDVVDVLIGGPCLWSPSATEEAILRADYDEILGLVAEGALRRLDARVGAALHLRPKAPDATPTAWAQDDDGDWVQSVPKGFYLRTAFTAAVLAG